MYDYYDVAIVIDCATLSLLNFVMYVLVALALHVHVYAIEHQYSCAKNSL